LAYLIIIIVLHAMKASKFEEIITSAIGRVKPVLSAAEAQSFEQMLSISFPTHVLSPNASRNSMLNHTSSSSRPCSAGRN
jgi:hypothetical protein